MNPVTELSLTNYTAIAFLERLGNTDPTQKQINLVEYLFLMMTVPESIDTEIIKQCVGDNNLAYYFLFVKINELCKLRRYETFVELENQFDEALVA